MGSVTWLIREAALEIKVIINILATHSVPFIQTCQIEQEEKLASTVYWQQRHLVTLFIDLNIDLWIGQGFLEEICLLKPVAIWPTYEDS